MMKRKSRKLFNTEVFKPDLADFTLYYKKLFISSSKKTGKKEGKNSLVTIQKGKQYRNDKSTGKIYKNTST